MAVAMNKLNARSVATITKPGRHSDGGGLYLVVAPTGTRKWLFLFRWKDDPSAPGTGKLRELGLGSVKAISLAAARDGAAKAREMVAAGIDPIAAKQTSASSPSAVTFAAMAEAHIKAMAPGWKNPKHVAQWRSTLSVERDEAGNLLDTGHCVAIRDKPIASVDTETVLGVLTPIWTSTNETASRLRGRIEAILDVAKAKGLRTGENPARWKGHLALTLPRRPKSDRGHHAALPYADVPAFIRKLRLLRGIGAFTLEFAILTAARSGEVRGARWAELGSELINWRWPECGFRAGRQPHSLRASSWLPPRHTPA